MTFPPESVEIVSPETVTSLPVAAMPEISPACVPLAVQRVATLPGSATCSCTVRRASGNASP